MALFYTPPKMETDSEAMYVSLVFDSIDSDLHVFTAKQPFEVDEWKCVVCHGTPRYPASLATCGHLGCRGCLAAVLQTKAEEQDDDLPADAEVRCPCPLCVEKSFTEEDVVPLSEWPLLMRKAWEALRVKCRGFKEYARKEEDFEKCYFSGSITALIEHEKTGCGNRIILCPIVGCNHSGPAFKMSEHYYKCDKMVFYCPTCAMAVKCVEREQHNCVEAMQKTLKRLEKQCKKGKFYPSKVLFPGTPGALCKEVEYVDEDEVAAKRSKVAAPVATTPVAASNHPFGNLMVGAWPPGTTPVTSPVMASTNAPIRANTVGRVLF